MTLVARENVFNPGFTHDYNPRNEEIRKAGRIWDILAQKYPEQKERIYRIRRTSGPMLGPEKSEQWPGNIQTLPYKPDVRGPKIGSWQADWKDNVQTLPYVPDGRDWRDKIQTLPYRY